jgi:hypothetical protein
MSGFKKNYALQYITKTYIDYLEQNKAVIIDNITRRSFEIYNQYFAKAIIIQKGKVKSKRLNSFFTKLAHTINPSRFSALDNPIRLLFGLKHESFFVSYIIINGAYIKWIKNNKLLLNELRTKIKNLDTDDFLKIDSLTDLKLLDMIFWFKANKENYS